MITIPFLNLRDCSFSGNAPVTAGGFAFGAKYISKVAPSSTLDILPPFAGPSAVISSELDGELSQQLQRLTKRDATTRIKSLQTLRSLVPQKSEDDVKYMLSPWAYSFGRLVMDTNRAVRAEACLVMGVIATAAGRNLAPIIKFIYPYWLLAQHDVSNEVVSAATSSMQATFPGTKAADVLLFCRNEVCFLLLIIPCASFQRSMELAVKNTYILRKGSEKEEWVKPTISFY